MRHRVLGTAGHIDHGKSALVQALTGIDPDRLKEEQLRGITIELGFADLDLGAAGTLSIVDVPGHERFVRHMVAGATGIDAVMLVIAADQGVQPQTREHLDICRLLDVRHGVVVLTKRDLVDPELLEVGELEVREFLAGSFLADAPILPVSSRSGDGLDELRQALRELIQRLPERPREGVARLPVDRSFVLRGFGTVVTGTLVSGELAEGDEVTILPGERRARVRGIQVHRSRRERARAGQRVAVNLQGVDCAQAPRGCTIAAPGKLGTSRRIWAILTVLPDAPKNLRRGGRLRFHQGTCDREARLRVLGELEDGRLEAELHLDEAAVLAAGDRFVLRRPAPVDTVAGGRIVDVAPPRASRAAADAFSEAALVPSRALAARLARAEERGVPIDELGRALGLGPAQLEQAASALDDGAAPVRVGARWIDAQAWSAAGSRVCAALEEFHREHPLRQGPGREELRASCGSRLGQDGWRQLLERLAADGRIRLRGDRVAAAEHRVNLTEEDRQLADRIERRLADAGLDPPAPEALGSGESPGRLRDVIDVLLGQGRIERIQDGRLFHAAALDELRARLRDYARGSRTIDVPTFKRLAGVTRKNAIPLLEQLDAERTTLRVGDLREILAPPGV